MVWVHWLILSLNEPSKEILNMIDKIDYRLLTDVDAQNYHDLRIECLKNHPENFGDTLDEELEAKGRLFTTELMDRKTHSFWYGAFDVNKLVGISGFKQQKRTKTKHRGDLIQVYTSPEYLNRGIATNLLRLTIGKAFEDERIEQIVLSVVSSNERAISLYRKFGFVQYGFLKDYFKKDEVYSSQMFLVLSRGDHEKLDHFQKEKAFNDFAGKLSRLFKVN
jgi:ribosomal protein S18 acetylase RimI-like enzyme